MTNIQRITNIQTIREDLETFLLERVRIDVWGLDIPYELYSTNNLPANSAIQEPAQRVQHIKIGTNQVRTKARFPYRIVYRFPADLLYHELPLKIIEGILAFIQILALIDTPPNIDVISVVSDDIEEPIYVVKAEDMQNDWLVFVHFAFDAEFNTTSLPNLDGIQPPDFFDIEDPPPVEVLRTRVYRAKQGFKRTDNTTFVEDSSFIINNS